MYLEIFVEVNPSLYDPDYPKMITFQMEKDIAEEILDCIEGLFQIFNWHEKPYEFIAEEIKNYMLDELFIPTLDETKTSNCLHLKITSSSLCKNVNGKLSFKINRFNEGEYVVDREEKYKIETDILFSEYSEKHFRYNRQDLIEHANWSKLNINDMEAVEKDYRYINGYEKLS